MAELKDWAISWLRSDKLWVKLRDDDDDRSLSLHCFKMQLSDEPNRFVMANFIPGGRFVVVLYVDGRIGLKEVNIKSKDDWELREVSRYRQDDSEQFHTMYWSQLLTETNLGRPLVAYVDRSEEKYGYCFSRNRQEHIDQSIFSLLVFLVDHIAGTIEQKQVVNLCDTYFYGIYGIHARGNIILCFYEHGSGWGITVSELGPDPALRLFNLSVNEVSLPPCASPVESYMMCRVCSLRTFSFSWCLKTQWSSVMQRESAFTIFQNSALRSISRH